MITILNKMIEICESKIAQKGESVQISFYVFFKNKNYNPELLFEVANWWIMKNKLSHFEKAIKIKNLLINYGENYNNCAGTNCK